MRGTERVARALSVCPFVWLAYLPCHGESSPALWGMWKVWSAQKCQRLRVNPKGWELDTERGSRVNHVEQRTRSTCAESLKTNTQRVEGQRMQSFHSSAMFGDVFCLARSAVVAAAALLTRVCRALRLLFVLFAYCSRIEWVGGALEWNRRTHRRGVWLWFACDVFYALTAPTVPRSLENIAPRQRLWFAGFVYWLNEVTNELSEFAIRFYLLECLCCLVNGATLNVLNSIFNP